MMKPRPVVTLFVIPTRLPRHAQIQHRACSTYRRHHLDSASVCLNSTKFRDRRCIPVANSFLPTTTYQTLRFASNSSSPTAKKPSSAKPLIHSSKSTHDPSAKSLVKPHQSTNKPSAGLLIPVPTKEVIKATKSIPTVPAKQDGPDKLNPPSTTYAPELAVPSQKEGQGKLGYLYSVGKAYIAFYKQGIRNVRATSKIAKQLRQKQRAGDKNRTASSSAQSSSITDTILTRAEWQIVKRSRADLLRLPPFAVLVLVFGEWLPLFVLWLTPVVPEPCRIPKQVNRDLEKSERRRQMRLRGIQMNAFRIAHEHRSGSASVMSKMEVTNPASVGPEMVKGLDYLSLITLGARLGCYGRFWVLPPAGLLRWRVRRRLEYLVNDDVLIERDGGWQGLGTLELKRACVERGIDVLGANDKDLKVGIKEWFEGAKARRVVD
jgi:hypothetical protein